MKKILLVAFWALSLASIAQNNSLGLTTSVNLTTSTAKDSKWKLGGNVGMLYDVNIADNWFLQPRLTLGYEEMELKGNPVGCGFISQWNVTIPVLLSYKLDVSPVTALRLNLGPYAQYAAFGRERQSFTDGERLGWWHGNFSRRFTYGAQIGAALECGSHFMILLDSKLSLKSSRLAFEGKERSVMLGIGYKF